MVSYLFSTFYVEALRSHVLRFIATRSCSYVNFHKPSSLHMWRLAMIFIIKNRWMYIVLIERCLRVLRLMNVARKAHGLRHGPQASQYAISKWEMAEPFRQRRVVSRQTFYKRIISLMASFVGPMMQNLSFWPQTHQYRSCNVQYASNISYNSRI